MNRRCTTCLFNDVCQYTHVCDDYAPMYAEAFEDKLVNKFIETERVSFRNYWFDMMDSEDRIQEYFG